MSLEQKQDHHNLYWTWFGPHAPVRLGGSPDPAVHRSWPLSPYKEILRLRDEEFSKLVVPGTPNSHSRSVGTGGTGSDKMAGLSSVGKWS